MFLEPYELIVKIPNLAELLNEKEEKTAYRLKIIKNDLIIKELRIWHKENSISFKNPVFESATYNGKIKNIGIFNQSSFLKGRYFFFFTKNSIDSSGFRFVSISSFQNYYLNQKYTKP